MGHAGGKNGHASQNICPAKRRSITQSRAVRVHDEVESPCYASARNHATLRSPSTRYSSRNRRDSLRTCGQVLQPQRSATHQDPRDMFSNQALAPPRVPTCRR